MAVKALPSQEVLRQLLRYEAETGKLFWLPRAGNNRFNATWAGREAFTATSQDGYKVGSIMGQFALAHRVIFALATGVDHSDEIDHIDADRSNNVLANLRPATDAENAFNRKTRSDNKVGIKGLCITANGRWQARIMVAGTAHKLGTFGCKTAAFVAYAKASRDLHGDYGRTGDLVIRQRDAACR